MQRFLISRLSSLGDVVCCLPAASALKAGFPGCHVTWIVSPRFADVVRCCTSVDQLVETAPAMEPKTWPRLEGEYDAALDLQGLLKSALPLINAKAKKKLGYHWQREGAWLFSQKVLPDPTSVHIVDQYVDVARAAGGQADTADFALEADAAAIDSVREKLGSAGPEGVFVAINAGAAWATKRWPIEHFAALVDRLGGVGVRAVLIGHGESDSRTAEELKSTCKSQPFDLVGKTNIKELIALLELASAHVGGDTGSTHLAAALGKPAIGLYSITRPERSCPYGQIHRCHHDPAGLQGIAPDAVAQTVMEAIA